MVVVRRGQWTFFARDDRAGGRKIRAGHRGRQERRGGGGGGRDERRRRRRHERQRRRRRRRGEFVLNGSGRASRSQRHAVSARWRAIVRRRRRRRARVRWKLFDQLRETFVAEVERGGRRREIGWWRAERVTTPADAVAAQTTRVGQTRRRHAARGHDGAAGDRRRAGRGRARVRRLLRVTTSRQNAVVHRRQLKLAGFLKGAHRHVHGAHDQRARRLRENRRREEQLQVVGRRRHVRAAQPGVARQIFDRQPFRRIDGQQAAHEILRRLRHVLPRRRVVGQLRSGDVLDDVFRRAVRRQRVERHFAAEHRVENHAQRPEIARLVVPVEHGVRAVRRNERDARARRRRRRAGRGGGRRRRTGVVQRGRGAQHLGRRVSVPEKRRADPSSERKSSGTHSSVPHGVVIG